MCALGRFKASKTLWGDAGKASASLGQLLGSSGKQSLQLDLTELEGMFAKPEPPPRALGVKDESKASKVSLLDAKRSTSVGIVMKRITDALQVRELPRPPATSRELTPSSLHRRARSCAMR